MTKSQKNTETKNTPVRKRSKVTNRRRKKGPLGSRTAPLGISAMTDSEVKKQKANGNDLDDRKFTFQVREAQDFLRQGQNLRLVAVNGKTFSGAAHAILQQTHQLHWQAQLNAMRMPHPEIVAATMPVWRSTKISLDDFLPDTCLSLKTSDTETCDAFNAALFQTYNTAAYQCDLSTVAFAIAAFVRAHPRFNDLVYDVEYELPFGKDTAWALHDGPLD